MLALITIGAPNSLMVGLLASFIGMSIGIVLGFTSGFVGAAPATGFGCCR